MIQVFEDAFFTSNVKIEFRSDSILYRKKTLRICQKTITKRSV